MCVFFLLLRSSLLLSVFVLFFVSYYFFCNFMQGLIDIFNGLLEPGKRWENVCSVLLFKICDA